MTSSGIFINSLSYSSGQEYDGKWELSNDVQGYYNVLYTHLDDGDIPIVYEGVNALLVKRNSNNATTVIHFSDLSSDTPADVETWFETDLADLLADIGVTITSATAVNAGESYDLVFDLAVTFMLANGSSTISRLFGDTELSGTTINVSGVHINNRPKFMGVCISECNQIFAQTSSNDMNLLLSAKDDLVKGVIIYIPNETNALNIQIVRVNAPDVACPINLRWSIVLQKTFGSQF